MFLYTLRGLEPSASGGMHIHAGTSCDEAGGHYWTPATDPDPWTTFKYSTDATGSASSDGQPISTGYSLSANENHAFVLHLADGTQAACGILQVTLYVNDFGAYPGYSGTIKPTGVVSLYDEGEGLLKVRYTLDGLEASTSGGMHIHAGTSCDEAGGHYWTPETDPDPWTTFKYSTDATGSASSDGQVIFTGYSLSANENHAFVIHLADGTQAACGVLQGFEPTLVSPPPPNHDASDAGDDSGSSSSGGANTTIIVVVCVTVILVCAAIGYLLHSRSQKQPPREVIERQKSLLRDVEEAANETRDSDEERSEYLSMFSDPIFNPVQRTASQRSASTVGMPEMARKATGEVELSMNPLFDFLSKNKKKSILIAGNTEPEDGDNDTDAQVTLENLSEPARKALEQVDGKQLYKVLYANVDTDLQQLVESIEGLGEERRQLLHNMIMQIDESLQSAYQYAETVEKGDIEALLSMSMDSVVMDYLQAAQKLVDEHDAESEAGDSDSRRSSVASLHSEGGKSQSTVGHVSTTSSVAASAGLPPDADDESRPRSATAYVRILARLKGQLRNVRDKEEEKKAKRMSCMASVVEAISPEVSDELRQKLLARRRKNSNVVQYAADKFKRLKSRRSSTVVQV
ncbi:hypothetical protein CYMTET_9268 [Cymbomonas tetramitiformis]|uniref:Superoxide dismutase copper/zinc binding domain-containing protein n=1 Tax=Cymbomonas tetramitiformis TaxID=36881 RepID=A0AAE0GS06_9CHLO|nr:hypothetical protein CYMTET_9268 [Cymbomonas tetramitiformis]